MNITIALFGAIIGYFLNNYAVTVKENEKGNIIKFSFDKYRTPIIFLWNILVPILLFNRYNNMLNVYFFRDAILSAICSAVFFIDFRLHIIPNTLNLIAFILGIILIFFDRPSAEDSFIGACIGLGFFLIIIVLSRIIYKKDGMGLGDAKFMGAVGLMFGSIYTVATIMFSFIFGAIGATILLISKNKKMGQEIAFGPYIVMAVMLVMFLGENILGLYFGSFVANQNF